MFRVIRSRFFEQIKDNFAVHPIVAFIGPRQCGKTTLARQFFDSVNVASGQNFKANYFDLEDPVDIARLENPKLALENLSGLIVIDEIQRQPDLFSILRVLVDKPESKQKFLILGSASRELISQSSQSLAGRIGYIEMTPFQAREVGTADLSQLWMRGGFPRSFLASSDHESVLWRKNYIKTFLEQDIPALGFAGLPAQQIRRFWTLLAASHGQIFNASNFGRAMELSHVTIKKYLDILTGTMMVRVLCPWFENIKKRQIKSPKVYIRDSGLFHTLSRIDDIDTLNRFMHLGASWEGFALEEVIRCLDIDAQDCFFWATATGAELDLLVCLGQRKYGFEFKYSDSPKISQSMKVALADLDLTSLTVISPGNHDFMLDSKIRAIGLSSLILMDKPLEKLGNTM